MTEKALYNYLKGIISTAELSKDLLNSITKTGYDTCSVSIEKIDEIDGFEIKIEHLNKLGNDFISGNIKAQDLSTISFALIASDFFYWDSDTIKGERIARVIFDWDTPEINYEITVDNMKLWLLYLESGNNLLKNDGVQH